MTFVVPDSIEPYVGFKALLVQQGWLMSPSQHARWPKGVALRAFCAHQRVEWEQVDAPLGWGEELFWVPSSLLWEGRTTKIGWPPQAMQLEPGKVWRPAAMPLALQDCQCGIYAVDDVSGCKPYLTKQTLGGGWVSSVSSEAVIVSVALWGQVVRGATGARGEKAYPQRLFVAPQQEEVVRPVAEAYGVPLEVAPL